MDKKIAGLKIPYFIIACVIIVISFIFDVLPSGMVGAFLFLIVFGELLNLIGITHQLLRHIWAVELLYLYLLVRL